MLFANKGEVDLWVYNPLQNDSIAYPSYRLIIQADSGREICDTGNRIVVGSQMPVGENAWVKLPPRVCVGRIFCVRRSDIELGIVNLPKDKRNGEFVFGMYPNGRLLAPKPDLRKRGVGEGGLQWWARAYSHEETPATSNPFSLRTYPKVGGRE